MSGISAIYFLDRKGKPIIFRNYRGEVDQDVSESFQKQVLELEETNMKPTFTIDNVHYCWTKHQNIYSKKNNIKNFLVVSVSKRNINLALIFAFLYKLEEILIDYFKVLEEETIRDNFVLIYELLDEILDHGYPQTTETKILKEYIKTESNQKVDLKKELELSKTLTNAISWRKEGVAYKKNEAYLDVIEKVDCLIAQDGNVLRSQVLGIIKMKSFLTGMPNVTLGLNDKVLFESRGKNSLNVSKTIEMDDLKFHQCVNMNKFESERAIEFVPPDGEFELMSYRLNMQLKPLIWVEVKIEHPSTNKYEYQVRAKTNFKNKSVANNVDIFIPVPNDIQNATFKTASGNVVYLSDREDILWNIKSFEGLTELNMKCAFNVPTVRIEDPNKHLKRPISLSFEIPYFTVSGIQVRYLKIVEKSGYEAIPWVRYISQNGDYSIRII